LHTVTLQNSFAQGLRRTTGCGWTLTAYFASRASAHSPAARGAEADVPVWVFVQLLRRSVVTWKETSNVVEKSSRQNQAWHITHFKPSKIFLFMVCIAWGQNTALENTAWKSWRYAWKIYLTGTMKIRK